MVRRWLNGHTGTGHIWSEIERDHQPSWMWCQSHDLKTRDTLSLEHWHACCIFAVTFFASHVFPKVRRPLHYNSHVICTDVIDNKDAQYLLSVLIIKCQVKPLGLWKYVVFTKSSICSDWLPMYSRNSWLTNGKFYCPNEKVSFPHYIMHLLASQGK